MKAEAPVIPGWGPYKMLIRMRCPACLFDYRFGVDVNTPLAVLPEIAKQIMRCKCRNRIPKIDKNTPIEKSLMSINAVPFSELMKKTLVKSGMN